MNDKVLICNRRRSVKMMTRDEHEQIAPLVKHGTQGRDSLLLGMLLMFLLELPCSWVCSLISSPTALRLGMLLISSCRNSLQLGMLFYFFFVPPQVEGLTDVSCCDVLLRRRRCCDLRRSWHGALHHGRRCCDHCKSWCEALRS